MFNMTLRGPHKDEFKIFNIYEQDIIYYAMIWPSSSIQLNNIIDYCVPGTVSHVKIHEQLMRLTEATTMYISCLLGVQCYSKYIMFIWAHNSDSHKGQNFNLFTRLMYSQPLE